MTLKKRIENATADRNVLLRGLYKVSTQQI